MKEILGLDQIAPGERAMVYELCHESRMRRRLCDIGLVEETVVQCVGRSPLGDPSAYLVRGAVIALRRVDAKEVMVVRCERED